MTKLKFEALSAEASRAIQTAEATLAELFPPGTHGGAFVRHSQVNPSPATVRGIAHGMSGAMGYLLVELDKHKARSRFTYRDVHYTRFIPDDK